MSDPADRSEYLANLFLPEAADPLPAVPLPDESHVESWRKWHPDGEIAFEDLAQQLPQLHFGVEPGIAKTPAYHKAILGADASAVPAQPLQRRGQLAYSVVNHWAGSLPTLSTKNRDDFEWLFRTLGFKGEEIEISPDVHALFITGLPNPGRLRTTRAAWDRGELQEDPLVSGCTDWNTAIKAIDQGDKTRFRDRIILMHHEPYANLEPKTVSESMHAEEWLSISATLRLEHEFAHYATRRLFNNMRLNLHDELIAACAADFHDCDALLLAQHSMGSAREAIKDVPGCKILTSPETAVLKLRQLLTETVFD